ncbi:MAG: hypothetical protein VX420_05750 [SAR324 cluster bacterium]|jgi:hypothetical protein|nr:hypothetical protein [SAR324 cluster bacterium]MEC7417701.1 hypothetical protein [SAR324 cluster bacterium]HBI29818.1 hypothetical protein [Deltaproteobacteria bacterium]HIF69300.1 hypothetical protein [Candidatus Lambdaproteobacteria bacterium]
MRQFLTAVAIILMASLAAAENLSQSCSQQGDSACIDWDRQLIIAEGIGVPAQTAKSVAQKNATAERAARLDAARNILEMAKGVNLSSTTTLKDAMLQDDTVRTRIQGVLYGLRVVGTPRYFSDGSVRIRMEASLRETIPQELYATPQAGPPQEIPAPVNTVQPSNRIDHNQVYSGLVVDARGTDVQPAMSPKIVDEDGVELYGSAYVAQEFVQKHGMAGYVKTIDQARGNDRVQPNPLVVQAVGASGANRTDLVLGNDTASALRKIAKHLNFLREARVVIVID